MKILNGLFIIITLMTGCSKDDDTNRDQQFVLDNGIEISILNAQDEDLLNPANRNAYSFNEMKLFFLIKGKKKEVYNINADQPRNLFLFNKTKPYKLGVGTYEGIENFTSKEKDVITGEHIAYLELSDTDTDTIRTLWEYKENFYFRNIKVWYNGKEYDKDQGLVIRK